MGALVIAEWGIPEKIISNQILVVCTVHSNYNVKLEVVTKSTDVGRKGRLAKTKTVLSMNKMEQLALVLKPCRN